MKIRFLVAVALVAVLWAAAPSVWALPLAADPCGQWLGDGGYKAQSAAVNISSSTALTQIVPLTASNKIYVCTWNWSESGTTPTYNWQYGTGSNCGTGTATAMNAVSVTTGTIVSSPPLEGTQLVIPAGNALCLQLGGTTPSAFGYVAYRVGP